MWQHRGLLCLEVPIDDGPIGQIAGVLLPGSDHGGWSSFLSLLAFLASLVRGEMKKDSEEID